MAEVDSLPESEVRDKDVALMDSLLKKRDGETRDYQFHLQGIEHGCS